MRTVALHRSPQARPLLGLRRRPGRLALVVMRLPLVLYRRHLGWMLGTTFMMLVHAGRRTGQAHAMTAMVMSFDPASGEVVIFSGWGPRSDWVRNIRARPALRVEIGRDSYTPQHRFLSDDESVAVATAFVRRHPYRVRLASAILGWPDLHSEAVLREFVRSHPFVAFRPATPA